MSGKKLTKIVYGFLYVLCYYEAFAVMFDFASESNHAEIFLFLFPAMFIFAFEGYFVFKINHNFMYERFGHSVAVYLDVAYIFSFFIGMCVSSIIDIRPQILSLFFNNFLHSSIN